MLSELRTHHRIDITVVIARGTGALAAATNCTRFWTRNLRESKLMNETRDKRRQAALRAWETMRGPVWKARRSERLSKRALENWARESGFRLMFLDADSGSPRTGIADAVLLRIKARAADQVELYLSATQGRRVRI